MAVGHPGPASHRSWQGILGEAVALGHPVSMRLLARGLLRFEDCHMLPWQGVGGTHPNESILRGLAPNLCFTHFV